MPRPALSYANVMSSVAVVLAMSGTAVAATQINGASLKDRSVAHTKLVRNTVTGAEVKESSLGRVPNADKLDGLDSTAFVKGANVKVYQGKRTGLANSGVTNVTLLTLPGLGRLDVVCVGDQLGWPIGHEIVHEGAICRPAGREREDRADLDECQRALAHSERPAEEQIVTDQRNEDRQ